MKILLAAINAKYIHSNLAVYSLKAYAKHPKVQIELGEYTINQYTQDILRNIYLMDAQVVAFSCYIWNIDYVLELVRELKKVQPHIQIWVGGPEVSYDAKEVLDHNKDIDLVMMGEGEATFKELVDLVADREANAPLLPVDSLDQVKGIAYRKEGKVVIHSGNDQMNMNLLPFVYQDLKEFENKIIYYETSRGCPYSCSYCLSSIDKKVRFRSFDLVEGELKFFLDNKVKQVKFVDRTFNCNRKHAMEIWNYIHENDNGITNFHFEISADILGEKELELFANMRPGLIQLEIGVQSTYEPTITEINRTMDMDKLSDIVLKINNMGNIHQHLDLIVGLPYEDFSQFSNSFNEVHALRPNQLQLGFLKVLKGSNMHIKQKEYNISYWSHSPYEVLSTNWIGFNEVLILKSIEDMVEVYYNSNQYVYSLNYLFHFYESPFAFYQQLAQYYETQGYFGIKHNRLARYEILRLFTQLNNKVDANTIENLLLYDLYLREKIKSRPSWAKDLTKDKKLIAGFLKSAEAAQEYDSKSVAKYCHMEPFDIDIEETAALGKTVAAKQFVLFDYSKRDPLTYDAKAIWIKELNDYEEEY